MTHHLRRRASDPDDRESCSGRSQHPSQPTHTHAAPVRPQDPAIGCLRLTADEYADLEAAAAASELPVSSYGGNLLLVAAEPVADPSQVIGRMRMDPVGQRSNPPEREADLELGHLVERAGEAHGRRAEIDLHRVGFPADDVSHAVGVMADSVAAFELLDLHLYGRLEGAAGQVPGPCG